MTIHGPLELLLIEQLDETVELCLGQPLLRLFDGPRQKLSPLGISDAFELGHLEHELLELGIFVGDAALIEGQLVRRRGAGGFAIGRVLSESKSGRQDAESCRRGARCA